jgi:hypothetical protein
MSAVYSVIDKWDRSSLREVDKPDLTIDKYDSEGNFIETITVPSEEVSQGPEAVLDYLEEEYDFDPEMEEWWFEAWFDSDDIALTYQGE